jgi:hypothetical protein
MAADSQPHSLRPLDASNPGWSISHRLLLNVWFPPFSSEKQTPSGHHDLRTTVIALLAPLKQLKLKLALHHLFLDCCIAANSVLNPFRTDDMLGYLLIH